MDSTKSLYELSQIANEITQKLIESGGEIDEQTEKALLVLEEKLPQKVDGFKSVIDYLEHQAVYWKTQGADRVKVAKCLEAHAQRLKDSMTGAMLRMNVKELEGHDYKYKLINSKAKVIIDNEALIPSQFKKITQVIEIDKSLIYDELKAGREVKGARLEEGFYSRPFPLMK